MKLLHPLTRNSTPASAVTLGATGLRFRNATRIAIAAALPMVSGGIIYLLWRSPHLVMFGWCERIGVLGMLSDLRSLDAVRLLRLPSLILYSWPDAAWVASGTFLFAGIWNGSNAPVRHLWVFLPTVLAVGGEIAQAAGLCPGTFDAADLVLCALVGFACISTSSRIYPDEA
jgi:hypothetical protein